MSEQRSEHSSVGESESVHKLGPDGQPEADSGPLIGPDGHPLEEGPEGYDMGDQPTGEGEQPQIDPNAKKAITAFIVYLDPEGHWVATADLDTALVVSRPAHFNDFVAACAIVSKDATMAQTVQNVITNFLNVGEQMRQQAENAQIAESLRHGGFPNRAARRHPG